MIGNIILMRGLPGSGKTTLANLLSESGKHPVFSVDDYFTNKQTGEYYFEFDKNHLAYKQCEENCLQAIKAGAPKIFVDNTFTLEWEMQPYFEMAVKYNYRIFVVTVENRHGNGNVHNTTEEQMMKMAQKFKIVLM